MELFITSGRIDILRAWLYVCAYIVGSLASDFLLIKKGPELLNQRSKIQEGTKNYDK